MKIATSKKGAAGLTLVETMVTVSIAAFVGGMIFLILNSGMNLYAKNTAVNVAHQQARSGVDQLLQNIHGSVSVPQLVDANLAPVAGNGPAAGVSFQRFEAGPFPVVASALATATSIDLASGTPSDYTPSAKARVIIDPHRIELDVVSSTNLGSGKRRYTFATPIGTAVNIQGNGGSISPLPTPNAKSMASSSNNFPSRKKDAASFTSNRTAGNASAAPPASSSRHRARRAPSARSSKALCRSRNLWTRPPSSFCKAKRSPASPGGAKPPPSWPKNKVPSASTGATPTA